MRASLEKERDAARASAQNYYGEKVDLGERLRARMDELKETETKFVESEHRLSQLTEEIAVLAKSKTRPTHDARAAFIRDLFIEELKESEAMDKARGEGVESIKAATEDLDVMTVELEKANKELAFLRGKITEMDGLRAAYLSELRTVLSAEETETTKDAAERVVRERNKARADLELIHGALKKAMELTP